MITAFHAKYFAHELTRQHGANDVGRLSQSLFDAGVDLNPCYPLRRDAFDYGQSR